MDGFSSTSGVIVLAATNRADVLDKALLRPGRFDRQVEVTLPDVKGREEIFMVHMRKLKLAQPAEEYAKRLSTLTPGFSGADIANVCNEAALIASRDESPAIKLYHFESAIDKIIGGLEKKNKVLPAPERNIVAHHEAGHAVAGWFLQYTDPLLKVSIVPRGSGALGYAQYLPKERYIMTEQQILDMMSLTLGGRAAEMIMFGHLSTGAADDLRKVTNMAYAIVTEFGMNPLIGNVSFPRNDNTFAVEKPFSEKTAKLIDEQVRIIVNKAYKRVEELLTKHKEGMIKIAKLLLEKEKISAEDMVHVLGPRPWGMDDQFNEYLKVSLQSQQEKYAAMEERAKREKEAEEATVVEKSEEDTETVDQKEQEKEQEQDKDSDKKE